MESSSSGLDPILRSSLSFSLDIKVRCSFQPSFSSDPWSHLPPAFSSQTPFPLRRPPSKPGRNLPLVESSMESLFGGGDLAMCVLSFVAFVSSFAHTGRVQKLTRLLQHYLARVAYRTRVEPSVFSRLSSRCLRLDSPLVEPSFSLLVSMRRDQVLEELE